LGGARQYLYRPDAQFGQSEIERCFSGGISAATRNRIFVIDGPTPGGFFIKSSLADATGLFLLHNVPGPYWKFSDFAKAIADPTIQKQAMAQRCWLSVDRIGTHGSEEDGYRFIERVLAKLAPPDAAFLVHPSRLITIPFDENLRARLARAERILPNP
jgi:hypothetical protein